MAGENLDGGVGGIRVEEHYRTRVKGIMALLAENGRCPEDRDLAIARHLVAEGRKSKFARNKLAAGRLSLMIAESERRHARWAMGFEQTERHHTDRIAHGLTRADTGGALPAAPPPSLAVTIQNVVLAVPPEQRQLVFDRLRARFGASVDQPTTSPPE